VLASCGTIYAFAEIITSENKRNRSFKVFKLLAESVREAAAVHPQRMILPLNVAGRNSAHVRHTGNNRALRFHDFGGRVPTGCVFVEIDDTVGFYELLIIHFDTKSFFNRFGKSWIRFWARNMQFLVEQT
jgi:hypothetical protein